MSLVRSLVRRATIALCATVCLSAGVVRAAEPTLAADFDGDGQHDRVTRDHVHPTVVRVWLSTTGRTSVVRSSTPLVELAAVDLDGDRRPELVATDPGAGLHVWTRAAKGFSPVPPRSRTTQGVTPATHGRMGDDPSAELDSDSGLVTPRANAVLVAPVRGSPRARTACASGRSAPLTTARALLPRGPRPPPASSI